MNPPSALYGAMNKERKPFTYTPGGLDLSQIKSERMAQRLMRNAMDQGVPEQPTPHLQSPPTPTALNVPNFNCLPVQVFPTFPLPANPKSLLKTRSNQQIETCLQHIPTSEQLKTNISQIGLKQCFENNNKNIQTYNQSINENTNNDQSLPLYDEYNTPSIVRSYPCYETKEYAGATSPKFDICKGKELMSQEDNQHKYQDSINTKDNKSSLTYEPSTTSNSDTSKKPLLISTYTMEKNIPETLEEITGTENNQNEVKVTKKQVETENNTEEQNGGANVEAAVTIKLPGKKSAAKTETKVEVVKNVRPDGSTEEVKTTTTKTTIDGKTEITTKTETTIIPNEDEYEEEEYVEEEEEEEEEQGGNSVVEETAKLNEDQKENNIENDLEVEEDFKQELKEKLNSQEETSETIITKHVTVTQSAQNQEHSEEEEEAEEEKEQNFENKNEDQTENNIPGNREESEDADDEEEENVAIRNEKIQEPKEEDNLQENKESDTEKDEVVDELESVDVIEAKEETEEKQLEENIKKEEEKEKEVVTDDTRGSADVNKETVDNEFHNKKQFAKSISQEESKSVDENKEEVIIEVQVLKPNLQTTEDHKSENYVKPTLPPERNIPLREPSVPLEKVEDVEIKPIGEIISKSRTENTEIITTSIDKPTTGLSTQTAYNRIENIVTVNKTTKTLDHTYDQPAPLGIPAVKSYFPPTVDRLTTSSYPPAYTPEPQTERRHSLLLDRLSVDRQMPPSELYQSNYQTFDQNQWTQEPQSEVLTVSNVKPSTITKNQQWYQQTRKEEVSYDAAPSLNVPTQEWSTQPQQRQTPLPTQTQFQYQPQTQPSYIDKQNTFRCTLNNSSTYQQSTYPSYTSKPTSCVGNNINSPKTVPNINKPPNQFSYVEKEHTENYQMPPQPYSSSYIPPPWEQDPNYVPENLNKNYYTSPPSNNFTSSTTPTWTTKPTSKFTKPKPTSYIPPAPNQSFVKPVTLADQPKLPGRKTYYSEYERRYISVPESTYIPTENKFQAQPDPSPQYYYDNNEPKETVEHEWRKELREFSEKTQSQTQTEQTTVKPPWEEDPKYYVPTVTTEYTPTPTWSQTLRPSTWRDRSFESEFGRSKELSRTNTLGRGRPQSSYVKSNISSPIPERPRGVSVDRYNPNNYKSPVPSEYPPVQSHTLDPSVGAKTYHNQNVPAYHPRASAEPRAQSTAFPQSRHYGEARAPPLQSRSFKYLQWITGTED